jgi:hypothetical protein
MDRERENPKKTITVLSLCAMLFAFCASAYAQQTEKVPRIGFLNFLKKCFLDRY